jgi:hypothetical protein
MVNCLIYREVNSIVKAHLISASKHHGAMQQSIWCVLDSFKVMFLKRSLFKTCAVWKISQTKISNDRYQNTTCTIF